MVHLNRVLIYFIRLIIALARLPFNASLLDCHQNGCECLTANSFQSKYTQYIQTKKYDFFLLHLL